MFNILLLTDNSYISTSEIVNDDHQKSQITKRTQGVNTEYPFGTKHESYSKYEDSEWKTYSNTSALEEHEIENIRKKFQKRQRLIREHFKQQQELMDDIWDHFIDK